MQLLELPSSTSLRPAFTVPGADWSTNVPASRAAFPQGYLPLYLNPLEPDDSGIGCRINVAGHEVLWMDISWQGEEPTDGEDPPLLPDLTFGLAAFASCVCPPERLLIGGDARVSLGPPPGDGRWRRVWRSLGEGRWQLVAKSGSLVALLIDDGWWQLTLKGGDLGWSSPVVSSWIPHIVSCFLAGHVDIDRNESGFGVLHIGKGKFRNRIVSSTLG